MPSRKSNAAASLERRGSLTTGWMDWTGVERDGGAWLTEELSEHSDWSVTAILEANPKVLADISACISESDRQPYRH